MTEDDNSPWPSHIENSKWWEIESVYSLDHNNKKAEETEMATVSVESGFEVLYTKVKDQIQDLDEEDTFNDDLAESLLLYFLTANALLERHSIEYLVQSRVSEEYENYDEMKSFFDEELNQSKRESLLYAAGLIDDGLKGEMSKTRRRRNKLAHNPERGITLSKNRRELKADIDRAYRAINRIEDLWRDCAFPDYNARTE